LLLAFGLGDVLSVSRRPRAMDGRHGLWVVAVDREGEKVKEKVT
jgi:hypothetical protein